MSELNHYTFSARMGNAVNGIVKIISKSCSALNNHKLKIGYLATTERKIRLQKLYDNNFEKLKKCYAISDRSKALSKSRDIDLSQDTKIKAIHTVSMFESLSQIEPMAMVAKTRHKGRWEKISSAVSALKLQLKAPEFDPVKVEQLVEKSEMSIRKMSFDTHSFLAKAEDELMLKKLTESVASLEFNVKADGLSLNASKGLVSIRANAGDGILSLDTTSFSGISCHAQVQIIEKDLKQRGLVLQRLCEHSLRLRKGGVRLIDPFPACPTDEHNRFLRGKSTTALPKQKSRTASKPHLLTHQYLKQMDSSRIKEKIV
ncbi:MAG: hypothetical protein AB1Z20_22680 [Desulfobacterales bacterium]